MIRPILLGCSFVLMLLSGVSSAALLAYEGFDIPVGALSGTGGATSTGWSGPWANPLSAISGQVVANSLAVPAAVSSFYTHVPIGNKANVLGGAPPTITNRPATPVTATTFWASVLLQTTNLSGFGGGSAVFQLQFDFGGSEEADVFLFAPSVQNNAGFPWVLSTGFVQANTPLLGNTDVQLAVFQVEFQVSGPQDRVSVWLNSDPLTDPASATIQANIGTGVFTGARMLSGLRGGADGTILVTDEIRVGGSPSDIGVVPEPATLCLLLAASVLLPRNRRQACTD